MTEKIYVSDNGEKREATQAEIAELKNFQTEKLESLKLIEAELEAKKAARNSALAKLAALGLTEEEIAAL
jgi:hypothetical protein